MTHPLPTALPLGRETVAYRVNTDPAPFFGAGRALLLQVAHPKVAAGVAQHSTYATDPWGRLFRTLDVMLKLAFGTPAVSAAQAVALEKVHRRVQGVTDDGVHYDARDPELLLWVWATLVDTGLLCYERCYGRLSNDARDRYLAESTLVAAACGVPASICPSTYQAFADYLQRVIRTELRATPAGLAVAHATMTPPLPRPLGTLSGVPLRLITAGLFPADLRAAFGFDWDGRRQRRLDAFFMAAGTALRVVPAGVRSRPSLWLVRRPQPLRVPWLQRHGAALTAERLAGSQRQR